MPKRVTERADVLPALTEVFRDYGFDGASLTLIGQRTKLGKGSLYHFFPGGKEEMASAVLDEIGAWFETHVFTPLRDEPDPRRGIARMLETVDMYFRSGQRVCLVGVFALGEVRDRFATQIHGYFARWRDALRAALIRMGRDETAAAGLAEDTLVAIQGGLVMARSLDDPGAFQRTLQRVKERLK